MISGYEAKKGKAKGFICKECSTCLNNLEKNFKSVKSSEFRDVYCVNCKENLNGGGKKTPDNTNEALCLILDHAMDDIYPMLELAPGEKPEETELAKGVKRVEHPEDATEQVYVEIHSEKQNKKLLNILDCLSEKGDIRYNTKQPQVKKYIKLYTIIA